MFYKLISKLLIFMHNIWILGEWKQPLGAADKDWKKARSRGVGTGGVCEKSGNFEMEIEW